MRAWLVAAALAAMTTGPAHAADVAQLGCLDEQLGAAARPAWAMTAEALFGGVEIDPPADAQKALQDAATTCTRRFGWTTRIAKAATEIFIFAQTLAAGEHRVTHDGGGLDPATVEATARALPEQDRQALLRQRHEGNVALDAALRARMGASNPTIRFEALMLGAVTVKLDDARARFARL